MVLPGIFGSPLVTIRNGSPPVCTSTVLIMRFSFMMRSILARKLRAVAGSTYRLAPSSLSYTGSKCRPALVVDQPVSKIYPADWFEASPHSVVICRTVRIHGLDLIRTGTRVSPEADLRAGRGAHARRDSQRAVRA